SAEIRTPSNFGGAAIKAVDTDIANRLITTRFTRVLQIVRQRDRSVASAGRMRAVPEYTAGARRSRLRLTLHIGDFPLVAVQVLEATLVHEAVVACRHRLAAAGGHGVVHQLVH